MEWAVKGAVAGLVCFPPVSKGGVYRLGLRGDDWTRPFARRWFRSSRRVYVQYCGETRKQTSLETGRQRVENSLKMVENSSKMVKNGSKMVEKSSKMVEKKSEKCENSEGNLENLKGHSVIIPGESHICMNEYVPDTRPKVIRSRSYLRASVISEEINFLTRPIDCLEYFEMNRGKFHSSDYLRLLAQIYTTLTSSSQVPPPTLPIYLDCIADILPPHFAYQSSSSEPVQNDSKIEENDHTKNDHKIQKNDPKIGENDPKIEENEPKMDENDRKMSKDEEKTEETDKNLELKEFGECEIRKNFSCCEMRVEMPMKKLRRSRIGELRKVHENTSWIKLLSDITKYMDRFQSDHLILTLHLLYILDIRDKELIKCSETFLLYEIGRLDKTLVLLLLNIYIDLNILKAQLFFQQIYTQVSLASANFPPNLLAPLCHLMAKASYKPAQFLHAMSKTVYKKVPEMSPKDLCSVLMAYGKYPGSVGPDFLPVISQRLATASLAHLSTPMLLGAISATVTASSAPDLLEAAEETLLGRALSPRGVATLIWAYSKLDVGSVEFYKFLKKLSLTQYHLMTPQGLSNSLFGIAVTLGRTLDNNGANDCELQDAAEEHVRMSISNFEPSDLSATALAYNLVGGAKAELQSALSQTAVNRAADLSPQHISRILYSLASFKGAKTLFQTLQPEVLQRLPQFSLSELCHVCWAYSVSRHHDKSFWEVILSYLPPSQLARDPRCGLLFPALTDINHVFPTIDRELLDRLKTATKGAFEIMQLNEHPGNFATSIEQELREMGEVERCTYREGFLIDIFFRGPGGSIAILLHTSLSLNRKTKRPTGSTIMRQRCLHRQGIGVANISWDNWKELVTLEDRRGAIRDLLQASKKTSRQNANLYTLI